MKAGLNFPSTQLLDEFLATKRTLSPLYLERMDTQADFQQERLSARRKKYDYDDNRILLGHGREVFERAKQAIRHWKMFPESWTRVYPQKTPIEAGRQVAVLFHLLGIWWWNSSEIQYTVEESDRFGFAYGTLPGHVESGEELFLVEMNQDTGAVWYQIKAFSRPAYWIVHLAYPFARRQQRRFVQDSMAQMQELMHKT